MSDHRSPEARLYRVLYKSARWQNLRRRIFVRDMAICAMCKHLIAGRFDVDHKKAHKGDLDLFWDESNLQLLHPACHAAAKQQEEVRGFSNEVGKDGWPVDVQHPANR